MFKYFGSVSEFPGSTGTYYYNKFFQHFNIEASYIAFKTMNLPNRIKDLINKNYSGFSVSMPFKSRIVSYLNELDPSVKTYNSCNTVLIRGSILSGFNTDFYGVQKLAQYLNQNDRIAILGLGNMGKMLLEYLLSLKLNVKVFSRSLNNWEKRHVQNDVVINCTTFGTSNSNSPIDFLNGTSKVFDLTFNGKELQELSKDIEYYSGLFFYKEVFLKQFEIYTGISPSSQLFDKFTQERVNNY